MDPKLDSEGDGLSDSIEYLFGTSPTAFTAQPLRLTSLPTAGDATLHLSFSRRAGITRPAYTYQTGGDLLQWNTNENVTEIVLSSQITDGVATETIDAAILVPKADANFVRILWQP